jgi:type IV fimbrial biogenesis protein FimT
MLPVKPKNGAKGQTIAGLTVVELLAIMAALAVIILVAVPGSSLAIQNYRMSQTAGNLLESMSLAYDQSTARSSTVRVCPSSNGDTCRQDGNWDFGWLVFSDGNADGHVQEFERLEVYPAPNPKIRIEATGAVAFGAAFNAAGLVQDREQSEQQGRFLVCFADSDTPPRVVEVDADGSSSIRPARDLTCTSG